MKKLVMALRVGINALTVHKMRSFLTMLGVVIGIAAVIALVAVGKGAQAQVVSQFAVARLQSAGCAVATELRLLAQRPADKHQAADDVRFGLDQSAGQHRRSGSA